VRRDPAELILEDLRGWARAEERPPHRLFAYVTERCNLRCPSCGLATGDIVPASAELSDDAWLDVAEQAIALGVRECYLTGGEVLVRRPVVLEVMQRLKDAGIRGILSTNGTTLDEAGARRVVDMGWDTVIVSLDGPDAARNDPLRSRDGVFDEASQLIRTLVASRRAGGPPEVHLHAVISRPTAAWLTEMVQLCSDLGVDYFAAEPVVRQSEACEPLMLDESARAILRDQVPRALARAGELGLSTNLGFLLDAAVVDAPTDTATLNDADAADLDDSLSAASCFVPFYNLVLHPTGVVSGCWQHRDDESPRVPEVSLDEAWYRGPPAQLRRDLLARPHTSQHTPEPCRRCCLINARDNRRFRALLLADSPGDRERTLRALRAALEAEPELEVLRRALRACETS
jgi:MoaA/NifB/PqqE/SkfB family radical SAM enzyme